jgi:electron transfer flavoprotein beta subunit
MGADAACLISDRKFAGADTLATSYVLSQAIQRFAPYDLVFAVAKPSMAILPRLAATAEKLGIPQITYTEAILEITDAGLAKRRIDGGYEVLRSSMPALLTVLKDAVEPRPFRAKRLMAFKNARH